MIKILISGDRNWSNLDLITESLVTVLADIAATTNENDIEVIHGNARGADRLGAFAAMKLNLNVIAFPAKWDLYGRAAGPIRNREMLNENPDIVLAFHNDISNSKGTKDCITEAKKRNIKVILITENSK